MSVELAIQELKKFYMIYGNKPIRRYEFQYFDIAYMGEEFIKLGCVGVSLHGKYISINEKIMEV